MDTLISLYIESRKLAWAPSTLRSENYRLQGLQLFLDGEPSTLWNYISQNKPYARVTAWTRVCDFWNWCLENGHKTGVNVYEKFRTENARLFKHTYQSRFPTISFEEAVIRINKIQDGGARALALQILGSGSRWHEAVQSGEEVSGKGSKVRRIYKPGPSNEAYTGSYGSFRRALRSVELKPHDLRKLCATRLVAEGLKEVDLLQVMGWTSMETAKRYLKPKQDDELKLIFDRIHKELK